MISKNVHRRHLNETQLGVLAQDLLPEAAARSLSNLKNQPAGSAEPAEKGASVEHAAKLLGIGRATVDRVRRVTKEAPELVAPMRAGKPAAYAAEQEVRRRCRTDEARR